MTHPTIKELLDTLHAARRASAGNQGTPEQVRMYRELLQSCPAFTPALLDLGRWLQLTELPEQDSEEKFVEAQRSLELAVEASERSAPALVELGYFLDTLRDSPKDAYALYQEGATRALETLEDAWTGMLRFLVLERTKESLTEALRLADMAERLFPHSSRIRDYSQEARRHAARAGLLGSDET